MLLSGGHDVRRERLGQAFEQLGRVGGSVSRVSMLSTPTTASLAQERDGDLRDAPFARAMKSGSSVTSRTSCSALLGDRATDDALADIETVGEHRPPAGADDPEQLVLDGEHRDVGAAEAFVDRRQRCVDRLLRLRRAERASSAARRQAALSRAGSIPHGTAGRPGSCRMGH